MLSPGRPIDETLAGKYYSAWAMLRCIRRNAIAGQVLAALNKEDESGKQFDKILRIIDKEI